MKSMKSLISSMYVDWEGGVGVGLFFPAETANKFHKLARAEIFGDYSFGRARNAGQALVSLGSEGDYQMSADRQLINEGFRGLGRGGRDQDSAVRGEFIPSVCAVEAFDRGVVNAEASQTRLRLARQLRYPFEREDLAGDGGEHRGLITRSRADFERAVIFGHLQQLGLPRDDEWL